MRNTQMNPEEIILREISRLQKIQILHCLTYMRYQEKSKLSRQTRTTVVKG